MDCVADLWRGDVMVGPSMGATAAASVHRTYSVGNYYGCVAYGLAVTMSADVNSVVRPEMNLYHLVLTRVVVDQLVEVAPCFRS